MDCKNNGTFLKPLSLISTYICEALIGHCVSEWQRILPEIPESGSVSPPEVGQALHLVRKVLQICP